MTSSFRFQLALRFSATIAMGLVAISAMGLFTLRVVLDRELNASILSVASIQAASVTNSPVGGMKFQEWALTPEEAASVRELNRYAQVWREDGESLLRSQYMTTDLPLDNKALQQSAVGTLVWRDARYLGLPIRSLYYPLGRLGVGHTRHVIQVAAPLVGRNQMLGRFAVLLVGIGLLISIATFLGSWWLAGSAIRPIHAIIDQAEEIGVGSLQTGISAYAGFSEYERLVQVLNTMLGRIRTAFESQRRFVADASHELRSPLTVMWGELEIALRRERDRGEYQRVIESTLEEVIRLSKVTDDLLALARSDAGVLRAHFQSAEVQSVASQVVERLRSAAQRKGVSLELTSSGRSTGHFDPDLLSQMLWNLTENAVKFSKAGDSVFVSVEEAGSDVRIQVADTGPGLGSDPARVFARFFRGDEARTPRSDSGGAGLGLSIVQAIVSAHQGRIEATNRLDGGACFTVVLPRSSAASVRVTPS